MPLYLVQTRKAISTDGALYKWSNRYFVETASEAAAHQSARGIWSAERQFHDEHAFCYETYANLVGDAPFTPGTVEAVPANIGRGLVNPVGRGHLLQPWTVVRVDFPVQASRPSRKFYRVPLREVDVNHMEIEPAMVADIQAGLLALSQPGYLAVLRDVDGQPFVGQGVLRGLTSRRLGREAAVNVPSGPPLG